MLFSNIRVVLFDLDGTLLDSAPDLGAATNKVLQDKGLPQLPLERYRPVAGAGARGLLGEAFGIGPDHEDFPNLREAFFGHYEANIAALTSAFEGVEPMIAELKRRGIVWGVVTNKAHRFTAPLIRSFAFFSTAAVVISGDTTPHAKPHPEPVLEALRRLQVPASSCIYVGDDERDIQAGQAAGTATVAATYGYLGQKSDFLAWKADAQINQPLELLQLLD